MTKAKSKLPNFFIIGAPKCGTTSMAAWLSEHPNIFFSPIKEPFYFSTDIKNSSQINTEQAYVDLFKDASEIHIGIGEGSTNYLFSSVAVENIEKSIHEPKYIVMLRNPVDMVYSLHEQQIFVMHENILDFRTAWQLSDQRRIGNHVPKTCPDPTWLDYQAHCMLGEQVQRLLTLIPRERVHFIFFDDLRSNARKVYLHALTFLGVPDDGRSDFISYNSAKKWKNSSYGTLIRKMSKSVAQLKHVKGLLPKRSFGIIDYLIKTNLVQAPRPPIDEAFRQNLASYYLEDMHLLERLTERDLSSWYTANGKAYA